MIEGSDGKSENKCEKKCEKYRKGACEKKKCSNQDIQ